MIYCRLVSRNGTSDATYAFGAYTEDLTGLIKFFSGGEEPVVIKNPEKQYVSKLWINKLYGRNSESIFNGEFKDEMAYEC